jgi:hypothetical protein
VVVDTKVIPVFDYQEEAPFWAEFENDHPKLLGVILDGVGAALKNLPTTKLTKKPRMADFTTFSVAAEPGLGFEPGTFFKAYMDNRGAAVETTLQAYPIVPYLEEIGGFDGEFADLLDKLDALQAVDSLKRPKFWPETPRKLSADLKRIAPALRAKGHDCAISEPGRTRQRTISFSFCPDPHKSKNTSATSATSANDTQVGENNKSNSADVCPSAKPHTSATSAETSAESLFDRQFADVCPPAPETSAETSAVQVVENTQSADVADVADVSPVLRRGGPNHETFGAVGDVPPVLFKECPRCGSCALDRNQGNYACQTCGLANISPASLEGMAAS